MTHKFALVLFIKCFYLVHAQYQESPCPQNFEYVYERDAVYGLIHLWSGGSQVSSLMVRANFTIAARLQSNYVGRLEPFGNDLLLIDYNAGKRVSFRVHFPVSSPLPKLTALTSNGDYICGGLGDMPSPGTYVTTISLQSLLYLKNNGFSNRPNFITTPIDNKKVFQDFNKPQSKPGQVDILYYTIPGDSTHSNRPQIIFENPSYENTFPIPQDTSFQDIFGNIPTNHNRPSQEPTQQRPNQNYPAVQSYPVNQNYPTNQNPVQHYPNQEKPTQNYPSQQKPTQNYPQNTFQQNEPPKTTRPQTTTTQPTFDLDERFPGQATPRPQIPQANVECGVSAGGNEQIPLVYKGEGFTRGEWPWLVAIYKTKNAGLNFLCSGTLISDRHVLTAAHCMQTKSSYLGLRDLVVKVGVYNLEDWGDDGILTRVLSSAVIHESYNSSTLAHDILLAKFEKRVQFTDTIRPACLWSGSTDITKIVGTQGIVAGWGQSELGSAGHGQPRMVAMPVVSTATCRASRPDFHKLTSAYTLCAGDRDGAGPCLGDSGGGLYLRERRRWRLRGIVSLSLRSDSNSCDLNEYVVFTDAAQYLAWIQYNMN